MNLHLRNAFTFRGAHADVWNVMAHAQKPDFAFRRNGRVHLNRRGASVQSTTGTAEVCASAVVMLDTPCSEVVWRVLVTHSIRQFPPSLPLPSITVCHHISTGFYHHVSRWIWRHYASFITISLNGKAYLETDVFVTVKFPVSHHSLVL